MPRLVHRARVIKGILLDIGSVIHSRQPELRKPVQSFTGIQQVPEKLFSGLVHAVRDFVEAVGDLLQEPEVGKVGAVGPGQFEPLEVLEAALLGVDADESEGDLVVFVGEAQADA